MLTKEEKIELEKIVLDQTRFISTSQKLKIAKWTMFSPKKTEKLFQQLKMGKHLRAAINSV